jgi:hypothetical protein
MIFATFTTDFPDNVRFERQSRWNLKLSITCSDPPPRYGEHSSDAKSDAVRELLLRHQALYKKMEMFDAVPASSPEVTVRSSNSKPKVNMDWIPSYTATPQSKTGVPVEESTKESRIRTDSVLGTFEKLTPDVDRNQPSPPKAGSQTSSSLFSQTASAGIFPLFPFPSSPHKRKVSWLDGVTTDVPDESVLQSLGYSSPSIVRKRPRQHSDTSTSSLPAFQIFEDDRDVLSDLENPSTCRTDEADISPSDVSNTSLNSLSESDRFVQDEWKCTQPCWTIGKFQRRPHVRHSRGSIHKHWRNLPPFSAGDTSGPLNSPSGSPVNNSCFPLDMEKVQTYIRNNYSEFEDRRKRRESGVISSDDIADDERRAYERIFLGDSEEEWASETDLDGVGRAAGEVRVQRT